MKILEDYKFEFVILDNISLQPVINGLAKTICDINVFLDKIDSGLCFPPEKEFSFRCGAENETSTIDYIFKIIDRKQNGYASTFKSRIEWIPHPRQAQYQYTLSYIKYLDVNNNIIDCKFYKSLFIVDNKICDKWSKDYNGHDLNNLIFKPLDYTTTENLEKYAKKLLTNEYMENPELYVECVLIKYKDGMKKWAKNLKTG
jgi:hypothetical protein